MYYHNATCHDEINTVTCTCIDGYTGIQCQHGKNLKICK